MRIDYHKGLKIYDFFVGISTGSKLFARRFTYIEDPHCRDNGYYSDYPTWEIKLETIGL